MRATEHAREQAEEADGDDHEAFHECREEDEGQWDADHSVDDAEQLATLRQRRHVPVALQTETIDDYIVTNINTLHMCRGPMAMLLICMTVSISVEVYSTKRTNHCMCSADIIAHITTVNVLTTAAVYNFYALVNLCNITNNNSIRGLKNRAVPTHSKPG